MEYQIFDVENTLSQLTLEEKISLLSGKDFWHTQSIPRLGVPSLRLSDGPNGIRGTSFFDGVPTACFPCGTALGATWDTSLLERAGELMGLEARAKGVHVVLGPTVNIARSPLGGRTFESFSEDPLLSGLSAAAIIRGIQSKKVAAAIKHYVCNDQEHERKAVNVIVSDRALREIYLLPFQIALRQANPWALLTAYNKVNGTHVSEDKFLLQKVLFEEWGYRGLLVSDWFGTYSVSESLTAGLDLEMPGPGTWRGFALKQALRANKLPLHVVDDRVRSVLRIAKRALESGIAESAPQETRNVASAAPMLRELASSSMVLLQNKGSILPFQPQKSTAVIGPNAKLAVICGGGSASVRPTYAVTPWEGIKNKTTNVTFAQGVATHKQLPLLDGRLQTISGQTGFMLKIFKDPPSVETREPVEQVHLDNTMVELMDYKNEQIEGYCYYAQLVGLFCPKEDGAYDFGLTVYGTGKLFVNGQLIINNAEHQTPGDSFFGAGTKEELGTVNLCAGEKAHICVEFGTAPMQSTIALGTTNMGAGGFRLGCAKEIDPEVELDRAVQLAKEVDQVIICAGLNADWESEGFDRKTIDLPGRTDQLISRVVAANPNTAVVIQSGAPVGMPWADSHPAILQAWYGGNEAGNAIADILFGDTNPSGKLPLSLPIRNEDNPAFLNFRSEGYRMLYGEDVYVGYRFYEKTDKSVLFPFGHGLSYSVFVIDNLQVSESSETDPTLSITIDVYNQSNMDGCEVVQVYVRQCNPSINRPVKELKAFSKANIPANDKRSVQLSVKKRLATSFWDEKRDMWLMEKGQYKLLVGCSSAQIAQIATFQVEETHWWRGL